MGCARAPVCECARVSALGPYVCVCVFACARMCACTPMCVHFYVCECAYVCVSVHMHAHGLPTGSEVVVKLTGWGIPRHPGSAQVITKLGAGGGQTAEMSSPQISLRAAEAVREYKETSKELESGAGW